MCLEVLPSLPRKLDSEDRLPSHDENRFLRLFRGYRVSVAVSVIPSISHRFPTRLFQRAGLLTRFGQ